MEVIKWLLTQIQVGSKVNFHSKKGCHHIRIIEMIYLHGGWNGQFDVADFWVFSIAKQQWQCLSENTAAEVLIVQFKRTNEV